MYKNKTFIYLKNTSRYEIKSLIKIDDNCENNYILELIDKYLYIIFKYLFTFITAPGSAALIAS